MKAWGATGEEARQLLGLAPDTTLNELDPERPEQEQMVRISYVLGIYRGLHTCWSDEQSDRWVGLPNGDAMFGGLRPLTWMAEGGIDALQKVRSLLDAWSVGH